jgi:probable phosphoglycerate mutase
VNRAVLSTFIAGPGTFVAGLAQDTGCINVVDVGPTPATSVVRVLNHCPLDPLQRATRETTMETLLREYRRWRGAPSDPTAMPGEAP